MFFVGGLFCIAAIIPILKKITVRKKRSYFETATMKTLIGYCDFSCNFLPISFPGMKTLNS
jgi:hypothetical protein